MFEDGRLTDPSLHHVEGQGGGGLVGVYSDPSGPGCPGPTLGGGGDACSVAAGHRPSAVSDILQQALAEVTDDPSVGGGMFGGQVSAAMDSGVMAIADLANDPPGTAGRPFDFVGSVPPEFLGVPTVRILAVEPMFPGGVPNVPTFSYLMETENSVERLGISKHLDFVANGGDCVVQREGIGHFATGFGDQVKFLDERQKFADLITAATAIIDPVSKCQSASVVDDTTHGFVLENQQEDSANLVAASANVVAPVSESQSFHLVENSAPNFLPKTLSKDGAKGAPLGSSQNPIRIVQQGNRYKSLQNLTPEQLAQITEVVQQQHLIRSSKETGQANVLYNPQTQTKIILRVVNPSEMCIGSTDVVKSVVSTAKRNTRTATQTQKKVRHKRKLRTEQKESAPQEVFKKEKDRKKGPRHRTRYGRLSRPPQYMSSEYKRVNRIDYHDSGDSEDDFSEFLDEDDSEKETTKRRKSAFVGSNRSDEGVLKRRRHRCDTCDKSYIGSKGLQRHLLLNPSHRNSDNVGNPDISNSVAHESSCADNPNETASSGSNPDMTAEGTPALPDTSPGVSTRSRLRSTGSQAKVTNQEPTSSTPDLTQGPAKRKRGRPPSSNKAKSQRDKLQELVDQCSDEELLAVFWPRICSFTNLWDFLLLKTTGGEDNSRPDLAAALSEFQEFHQQIARTFQENLVPIHTVGIAGEDERNAETEEELAADGLETRPEKATIEICDGDLARCLGLSPGSYELREDALLLPHKLFAPSAAAAPESPVQLSSSHVDEMVSQGQVAALPLRKRPRLAENTDSPANLADQSDAECFSSLPAVQPVTGENVEPAGTDLVNADGPLLDKGENSVSSGDGDSFAKDFVDGSSSRAPDSSENSKDILSVSAAGKSQSLKEDGVTDSVAGSMEGDGVTDSVARSMEGDGVTDSVARSMVGDGVTDSVARSMVGDGVTDSVARSMEGDGVTDSVARSMDGDGVTGIVARSLDGSGITASMAGSKDGIGITDIVAGSVAVTTSAEATYNMPFQSSNFPNVYSSGGGSTQLVNSYTSVDIKAPLFHLTSSYRGDDIDLGNHNQSSSTTTALSELQSVAVVDLTQPDTNYMSLVTANQASGYKGLFAGIGDVIQAPVEAATFLPPEFNQANFDGHPLSGGTGGPVNAVQTNHGLVFLQNPDGSITLHGQPGQDSVPLEMVQTLMGMEQQGGQVVYQDYQQGYVVENWNSLK